MGFLDDVGNWFGSVLGINQSNQANQLEQQSQQAIGQAAQTLQGITGKSPSQFAAESAAAGKEIGSQMGQQAAQLGTQQALQAARTAGLNKGQAALEAGQQAGQLYSQGQLQGQGLGMGAYGTGAQAQLGGTGQQIGLGLGQMQGGQTSRQQGQQAGGGGLMGIGQFIASLSDKNAKEDVKKAPTIDSILRKIKPVSFNYKKETGESGGKHVGIMAQDVEKTPMKENVIETTAGKAIDTGKQENSNLALIVELAAKVDELKKRMEKKNA